MSQILSPDDYDVRVRFLVDDRMPGLRRVERRLGRMDGVARGVGMSIRRHIGGALLAIGSTAGLMRLGRGFIGINTEIQNAEIGIGSLVSALTGTDMTRSLESGRAAVNALRRDAARGAGELTDYTSSFQQILGPALAAGVSMDRVLALNRNALGAGFALRGNEGLSFAGLDVVQALTSGAGSRTTAQVLNPALMAIGVTTEQFNAKDRQGRFATLERAFGNFGASIEVMSRTWDAQMATLVDSVKNVGRVGTGPLFTRMSDQLIQVNTWIEQNNEALERQASIVGDRLLGAYERLVQNAPSLARSGVGAASGAAGSRVGMTLGGAGLMPLFGGIGAVLANAAARFPEDAAKAGAGIMLLVRSLGGFASAIYRLFIDNALMRVAGRGILAVTAAFGVGLSRVVEDLTTATKFIDRLLSTAPLGIAAGAAFLSGDRAQGSGLLALQRIMVGQALDESRAAFQRTSLSTKIPVAPGTGPGGSPVTDTTNNFNGPVTITIQAKRLDDPNTVAKSFREVLRRLEAYPGGGKPRGLTPRPT